MKRFITSIYNKFFQPINFCVMLFLRFRIRKRSYFRKILCPVYILTYIWIVIFYHFTGKYILNVFHIEYNLDLVDNNQCYRLSFLFQYGYQVA